MSEQILPPAPRGCVSCPYLLDVPSGVWSADEYEKLPAYDNGPQGQPSMLVGVFLCHQTPEIKPKVGTDTVCRGWLTVHCEGIAARLAVMQGQITPEQLYAEVQEPLYASGAEAAAAGIKGIKRPNKKARKIIDRLAKAGRKGKPPRARK